MKEYSVVIVGATGLVGRLLVQLLDRRHFPVSSLRLLASSKSEGQVIPFRDQHITVENIEFFEGYNQTDIAIFAAGANTAQMYAPKFVEGGAKVVDNSSRYRYEDNVPLVLPEVNGHVLETLRPKEGALIANPNCSTSIMLLPLAPIHHAVGIESIETTTMQSVAGSGQKGLNALAHEAKLPSGERHEASPYAQAIFGNVYPIIDVFLDSGFSKEEMKMNWETKKILSPDIDVNATCTRVPVFYGHTIFAHLKLRRALTLEDAQSLVQNAPGVVLYNEKDAEKVPTPFSALQNHPDDVVVGRMRQSLVHGKHGLNLMMVSDNLQKGAALNNIQILETMMLLDVIA